MKTEREHESGLPWIPFALSVGGLIVLAVIFELFPLEPAIDSLQEIINRSGPVGPLLFVLLFAVAVVFPPLSNRPFVLLAGVLFGSWLGVALTIIGATLGAIVNFWIARKYGREWIHSRSILAKQLDNLKPLGDWQIVLLTRMFAGFTFDWYSYLLGLLGIRWIVFISTTALGITPGVIAEVYAGRFLLGNPWISVLIGLVLAAISLLAHRMLPKLLRSISDASKLFSRELTPSERRANNGTKYDVEK